LGGASQENERKEQAQTKEHRPPLLLRARPWIDQRLHSVIAPGNRRARSLQTFRHFRSALRESLNLSDKFGHQNCVILRHFGKSVD
jgi:hypothetical protein